MRNAESVKARLKNIAKETGRTMQDVLIAYGLERTIMRLTKSSHVENFTLKGGIFLYALMDGDFARATTDIDLLAQGISNDIDKMKEVFCDVFSVKLEDPLRYDLDSLSVKSITEFKDYHGVNVTIDAYLDRTKIQVSIDVGFGDVIYPKRVVMDFPVILSEENPRVYAYSLSSSIAEKFEAIIKRGVLGTRIRDFYDVHMLLKTQTKNINKKTLKVAIQFTAEHRGSEEAIKEWKDVLKELEDDETMKNQWKRYQKNNFYAEGIEYEDLMKSIKEVGEVYDSEQ